MSAAASAPTPHSRPSGRDLDALESAHNKEFDVDSKRPLRVSIVTENFLPKIDGVTRTLAMLLEHLQAEGHEALVLGPSTPLTSYAGAEVVSTQGIPLMGVYRGLGLNFLRPRFIRKLREFDPDVCMFVDPIWLCAQTIPAIQFYFPDIPLISSYHTNLAMYATLFGFSWLTPVMWGLQRNLHSRCNYTYCPSPSTARMLGDQGFENVRLWPRGVDVELFRPEARDFGLRQAWGVEPQDLDADRPSPRVQALDARNSLSDDLPPLDLPPPYIAQPISSFSGTSPSKLAILYVGRVSWEKNLRLLIEAMRGLQEPDIASGRPACQLIFVGDGPGRGEAESLCAQYGLDALFLGFKKGQELAAAYASADVFAFPSFTETFGQVVSEAQASGLPVVGLKAEGVSDLVEHGKTGLLLDLNDLVAGPATAAERDSSTPRPVIPSDPHALLDPTSPTYPLAVSLYRDLLVSIALNHEHRRAMGSAAHLAASKRSWWGAMEQLCDGYRELAALKAERRAQRARKSDGLTLSRTSTIEFDVVCEDGSEKPAGDDDAIEASASASAPKRKRLLAFSRTPLAARSVAQGGTYNTLLPVKGDGQMIAYRLFEAFLLLVFISYTIHWVSHLEALSFLRI
ncbi:hypothetical protein Rhopal_003378-T1 [Rhodotorula paludigena]|uniref:Glycosyltransferase family 4 protein n=1 Tax=Rhodotorula paludigena TaxID=86838 RepID=A0AAV5GMV6_9BASI|nr:hypothetical protein Rhopal_003378-T1 [Rhodotorula paludigena]